MKKLILICLLLVSCRDTYSIISCKAGDTVCYKQSVIFNDFAECLDFVTLANKFQLNIARFCVKN